MTECMWCGKHLEKSVTGAEKKFCGDAHRMRYKRAERAAALADLVEKLGPFVAEEGIFVYKELVDHLAGRVNER